ncbi:MAG: hypothetical protein ABI629_08770 [bacterium]
MTDAAATLPAIAAEIAKATGVPWGIVVDRTVPTMHGPDGAALVVYEHGQRLEVSGSCGKARDHLARGEGPFVVTVAADRPAAAIAAHIMRRLLPSYLPALSRAREKLAARQVAVDEAQALLAELIELAGGGSVFSEKERTIEGTTVLQAARRVRVYPATTYGGEAEPAPACVSIELGIVDAQTARDLLRFLRGRAQRLERAEA